MATYVNDLRLKEIATGDESGTWGTSTNTNLELIAEAFSFGTEAITTNADTHTTTIADGATDPGRSLFLKYTGTLDSACTITIGPNTVSKLWLIENATSGSQNIIIKQGSGATVTIANGQTKAIYSDGAGSGAAMVDALQDLSIPDLFIDDDLTFTSDSAVITFGADGDTTLTHTDGSGLTLNSTNKIMFNDASQFIQGSSATVLSLGATDEIDLTATAMDFNGTVTISGDTTLEDGADLITASAGTSNFRAGVNAGNSIASGGNYNVVVGDEAGTAITTGDHIVAVGYAAGDALNTAEYTAVFGSEALTSETAGTLSTAIGYAAGYSQNVTSGATGNTNIGAQAGFYNVTGTNNTRVGYNAGVGASGQSNSNNTIVGALAGDALTTSNNNVAIGYQALTTDTLGTKTVAIGVDALKNQNLTSNTDTYNVALGYYAGRDVTVAIRNTLIGGLSGDALTEGARNTTLGYAALSGDTLGSRTVAIGYEALGSQNFTSATDSYNTAVGYAAGNAVTTGIRNTIVGGNAGIALTTGGNNVVVGYEALKNEDGHGQNTAIGSQALFSQNAGADANNTAVGFQAGAAVSTGVENTLVGSLAGDALTNADYNTVVGMNALSSDTRGSRSTAIGTGALNEQNFTSAKNAYNVAIGYAAGNKVSTGENNTLIGSLAGDVMTTGSLNVFIGKNSAGSGVVTGNDNTAVGVNSASNLTSGTNNLFLGHDAGVSGSPGGNFTNSSNTIVLGDENIVNCHIQVDWTVASDERDKTDFAALDLGLDFVKALEPVTYYWDKRSKYGNKFITNEDGKPVPNPNYDLDSYTPDGTHKEDWMDIGFKAQAVQALEEAAGYTAAANKNLTVSTTDDGKQLGLQYSKFVPILVKAIQELSAENAALTARIEALES